MMQAIESSRFGTITVDEAWCSNSHGACPVLRRPSRAFASGWATDGLSSPPRISRMPQLRGGERTWRNGSSGKHSPLTT